MLEEIIYVEEGVEKERFQRFIFKFIFICIDHIVKIKEGREMEKQVTLVLIWFEWKMEGK